MFHTNVKWPCECLLLCLFIYSIERCHVSGWPVYVHSIWHYYGIIKPHSAHFCFFCCLVLEQLIIHPWSTEKDKGHFQVCWDVIRHGCCTHWAAAVPENLLTRNMIHGQVFLTTLVHGGILYLSCPLLSSSLLMPPLPSPPLHLPPPLLSLGKAPWDTFECKRSYIK